MGTVYQIPVRVPDAAPWSYARKAGILTDVCGLFPKDVPAILGPPPGTVLEASAR
jgi:hypothetical protein